jgi:hypothetical protein
LFIRYEVAKFLQFLVGPLAFGLRLYSVKKWQVSQNGTALIEKRKTNESSKRSSKKAGLNAKKASNEDSSGSVLCENNSEERVVLGSSVAGTT